MTTTGRLLKRISRQAVLRLAGVAVAFIVLLSAAGQSVSAQPLAVIDSIAVPGVPAAIALNPTTNRAYVGADPAAAVTTVDTVTGQTGSIPAAGFQGQSLAADPVNNRIYIGQQFAGRVLVVNGATDLPIVDCPIGTIIFGVTVNPTTNLVYVVRSNLGDIQVMNGATCALGTTIVLGPGINSLSSTSLVSRK